MTLFGYRSQRATLRDDINDHLAAFGESVDDIVHIVASAPRPKDALDFDTSTIYGIPAFTAWTPTRVLFPATYDSVSWVESVPRDPCDEVTALVGGGTW